MEAALTVKFRQYNHLDDYKLVDNFLIEHYKPGNQDGNWVEPAWEYMHGHPFLDRDSLGKIGIWEDDGNIVAVANFESILGEAFFQFHPAYRDLRKEMLQYAEEHLVGRSDDGTEYLRVFVNDNDEAFNSLVETSGYQRLAWADRPMAQYLISNQAARTSLPDGFRLKSLADECDWGKVHRVLWRGFDHPGEPPADGVEEREMMIDTPKARRDLKIVVQAPNRDFASFCGMWFEPTNHYAYVEPVATDPDYRRLGLGRAAVLEGIRRCAELGAKVAYVGSDQEFYLTTGFKVIYSTECWEKRL